MVKITHKSLATQNHGDKKSQQSSPVIAHQDRVLEQVLEKLTLYIPEKLDLDSVLEKNPPTFIFHKDYFVYILHLVTYTDSKKKDVDYEYTPINAKLLQRRVRHYDKYLGYLVRNNILHEKRQYIVGKESRGYKFNSKYLPKLKPAIITKKTLIKSLNKFIDLGFSNKNAISIDVNFDTYFLSKWFNDKLKIDYKGSMKWLYKKYKEELVSHGEGRALKKFASRHLTILKFKRGEFVTKIDSTVGRMHTVITQLKSELRQFVTYDGEPLVAIDVVNCQPYLMTVLLNPKFYLLNNMSERIKIYNKSYPSTPKPYYGSKNSNLSDDKIKYINWVSSGQFYEKFGESLLSQKLINIQDSRTLRKQAKDVTFSSIFSPNQSIGYNDAMKKFEALFPSVYKELKNVKKRKHNTLACSLQNLEADLILRKAAYQISVKYPNAPIFTLHDAIITTEKYKEKVSEILYNVLNESIGVPPTLKYEPWAA